MDVSFSSGRQPRELRTYDFLDRLSIPYTRIDHPAAMTMEACREVDRALGVHMCKNLFLCNRQQTVFYLLLMPGDKKFKTKMLSAQLGCSRLSFADEGHMEALLDIHPGSVSVMGLMNDKENRVRLLIDRDLTRDAFLGCHPCVNTSSLRLSMSDLLQKFLPAVVHEYRLVDLPEDDQEIPCPSAGTVGGSGIQK